MHRVLDLQRIQTALTEHCLVDLVGSEKWRHCLKRPKGNADMVNLSSCGKVVSVNDSVYDRTVDRTDTALASVTLSPTNCFARTIVHCLSLALSWKTHSLTLEGSFLA